MVDLNKYWKGTILRFKGKHAQRFYLFFENSYKQINSKNENPTTKLGNTILWIRKRSSSNSFRIYLKPNGKELRFEIELKKL